MKKRLLCAILSTVMIFALVPANAFAASTVDSGTCGTNVNWTLDNAGVLTISGTGAMQNYSSSSPAPWDSYSSQINEAVIRSSVTSIGSSAFSWCDSLASVSIPGSVTSIGSSAFKFCSNLSDVTIPSKVTSIGDGTFQYCTSLTSITIPNGVTRIGDGAFSNCGLKSITIPGNVTSIGNQAFSYCTSLASVTIPSSVTDIGVGAFQYCTSLKSVTIPDSVTNIGDYAFQYCTGLMSIKISDSITSIGDHAFFYCTSLKSVTIPSKVTSIGFDAFAICNGLTNVVIPGSVTSIDDCAFDTCTSLADVYYTGGETQWNALKAKIGASNDNLLNANIHYHYIPPAQRTENGYYIVPMDFGDLSVNVSGTANAYYRVENKSGEPQPGIILNYTLNGVGRCAVTDGNGLITVTTPRISINHDTRTFTVIFSAANGSKIVNAQHTFEVAVKKLSYEQEWSGKLKLKGELGIGPQAGAGIGAAEVEASLVKGAVTGGVSGAITINDAYDDGDRTLTLKFESGGDIGLKVKTGIDAGMIGNAKINVVGAGVGVSTAGQKMRGLKLTHYDPANLTQNVSIAKYMLYPVLELDNSVVSTLILDKIESVLCDVAGTKHSAVVKANYGVGQVEIGEFSGSLVGVNGDVVWNWDNSVDYIDSTLTRKKSFVSTFGAGLGADIGYEKDAEAGKSHINGNLGSYIFGGSLSNHKEISAEFSLDNMRTPQSFGYKTYLEGEKDISWTSRSTDTYASIKFSGESAKTLVENNTALARFADGSNPFIDQQDAITYMGSSGLQASVTETTKVKKGLDIEVPFKIALGISAGITPEISGEHSYSYSNTSGVMYNNSSYITTESEVTLSEIEKRSKSLGDIFAEPLAAVWDLIKDTVSSVIDSIENGVKKGMATIKGAGSDLYGKIFGIDNDNTDSYAVLTVKSRRTPASNAAVSATIGEPYIVALYTDAECTQPVSDEALAQEPVSLTIEYTEAMLEAAGAESDADVLLLRMDHEKNMYVFVENAVQNKEEKYVSAEITQNGEYILAVDTAAPIITGFALSDQTLKPTITAFVSDLSGINTFRFWIDDMPDSVTQDNLSSYYNAYTGEFTYAVSQELTPGEHTAHFLASDKKGNTNSASVDFTFEVRQMTGEITSVDAPKETVTDPEAFPVTVTTNHSDDVEQVILSCSVEDRQVAAYRLERDGDIWRTNVLPAAGEDQMTLIATAYDGYGNKITSAPVTVKMDIPEVERTVSLTQIGYEKTEDVLKVSVTARNGQQNAASGLLMVAAYDANDRMISVNSAGFGFLPGSENVTTVELPFSDNTFRLKAFLLDPTGAFIPQCGTVEAEIR